MSRKLYSAIALLALPLFAQGCFPFWLLYDDDDDYSVPPSDITPAAPAPANSPPDIVNINIAEWPPLGANSEIQVEVRDVDSNLSTLELTFRERITFSAAGTGSNEIATINGWQLGEGLGTLTLVAEDTFGATATRWVENLLVDLSPPEITLGETILPGDGFVEAWIADAWVIGSATLRVGDVLLEHDFEDGYPSTLGEEWDYSLVKFDTSQLPEGHSEATMTAYDAAGNSTDTSFTLTIDSIPPDVQITSPAANTTVSGPFQVNLSATDPGDGPVWIEVSIGGTPAASAVGPSAIVALNADELTPGPVNLEAVAIDQAGNRSSIAKIPLIVE
jgi:hypothetical protein